MAKRVALFFASLVLLLAPMVPVSAYALGNTTRCDGHNLIWAGLWAGINIALGASSDCNYDGQPNNQPQAATDTQQGTPAVKRTGTYVALGDSVAAGLGLPQSASSTGNDETCGVSSQAYPALVAATTGRSYINVACSGATAGDTFTEQHSLGLDRDIGPQLNTAFASGVPSLITITAGANDAHWQDFIRKCYAATCGTNFDDVVSDGLLAALDFKLNYALSQISSLSNGRPPRVILTGYYNPLSGACIQQSDNSIAPAELAWLDSEVAALNQTIKNAAANYSFARFAPVSFSGHELCTADPWVQGVDDAAPFHPTAQGQQVIARSIIAANR